MARESGCWDREGVVVKSTEERDQNWDIEGSHSSNNNDFIKMKHVILSIGTILS